MARGNFLRPFQDMVTVRRADGFADFILFEPLQHLSQHLRQFAQCQRAPASAFFPRGGVFGMLLGQRREIRPRLQLPVEVFDFFSGVPVHQGV